MLRTQAMLCQLASDTQIHSRHSQFTGMVKYPVLGHTTTTTVITPVVKKKQRTRRSMGGYH